jgi:hypothetical protein
MTGHQISFRNNLNALISTLFSKIWQLFGILDMAGEHNISTLLIKFKIQLHSRSSVSDVCTNKI